MSERQQGLWLWFALTTICLVLLAFALPVPASHAGSELPDRSTPTPAKRDDRSDNTPLGAYIELHTTGAPLGAWSVVQWQDSAGNWHDVEGWRGRLDANGSTRWWVAAKDFGTGPFRWVVMAGSDKPILAISQTFNLPAGANDTRQVVASMQQ